MARLLQARPLRLRRLLPVLALGAAAVLGGCVAYPAGYYGYNGGYDYDSGYGYGYAPQPYYGYSTGPYVAFGFGGDHDWHGDDDWHGGHGWHGGHDRH